MTAKSLGRGLATTFRAALLAAAIAGSATAQNAIPSALGVPGNTVQGQPPLHSADTSGDPIRGIPAPAGVNPVAPSFTRALQQRAQGHLPQSTPVPPTQEVELLDPNVDPMGRPTVKVSPIIGPDGTARIDIPPAVLVHRFYYTGDRSFQGPMLPGGPTVVVFNHPADGERIYLEIQMPPGAPRIIYTRHSIEYNYGVQSIILSFGAHGRPKVTFRQGVSGLTKARIAHEQTRKATARFIERTGIPAARQKVHDKLKNVAGNAADRLHDIGKAAVTPVIQIVKLIPGIQMLTSAPENSVEKERDALVQRASSEATRLEPSIPTNLGGALQ